MIEILAKTKPKKETLEEHSLNAVNVWRILKNKYECFMSDEEFWQSSFISIIFHDFGKVSQNFENMINKKLSGRENNIRHEFISGIYLYYLNNRNDINNFMSIISIFSHHKKLNDELFKNDAHKKLEMNLEKVNQMSEFIFKTLKNEGININIREGLNKYFCNEITTQEMYNVYTDLLNYLLENITSADRKKYILFKAVLNIADWISSGEKELKNGVIYNCNVLQQKIVQKLRNENKNLIADKFKFRQFQMDSISEKNVIAVAPTGSGKTEAALLWASNKKENDKIIYLLPTRVTSNAIYKRLSEYFGVENTAIIHSSAYFLRKEIDDQYTKLEYLKDKTFFKNVNVCTVDQILTQGFNLGFWEIKTFHLIDAKVIIDEIHLYQPYTLGLIVSMIKYMRKEFRTKFYIMSATMPKKLKNLLQKALANDYDFIRDTELLEASRNEFQVKENSIDELEDEILKEIEAEKKILIVVNTVDEAIRLYEKYLEKAKNIICYHSRFIQKDRIDKEKEITDSEKENKPLLLIATQVVEVSLDIDFDVLFTENAPIDAIIQRAGRINRKREKRDTKVIIFKHTEISEKFIYTVPGILGKTFEILKEKSGKKINERELIELVDFVYEAYDIEKDASYIDGLYKYDEIQKKYCYIKDNSGDISSFTREDMDSINVIPVKFMDYLKDKPIEEKVKYELSIRINGKTKKKIIKSEDGFNYIYDTDYGYNKGLTFKDNGNMSCFIL